MDSDHLSLLEGPQAVRRAGLSPVLAPARFLGGAGSGVSHRRRLATGLGLPKIFWQQYLTELLRRLSGSLREFSTIAINVHWPVKSAAEEIGRRYPEHSSRVSREIRSTVCKFMQRPR